jgi:hypothetical protein
MTASHPVSKPVGSLSCLLVTPNSHTYQHFSPQCAQELLSIYRTMFPHKDVSDEAYPHVVRKLDERVAQDQALAALLSDGVGPLKWSTLSQFPKGLANSSGQVGKNYMRHTSGTVWGIFERPVRMYRGIAMGGFIKDEQYHRPDRGFAGGYYIQTNGCGLFSFASSLGASADVNHWGPDFTSAIKSYQNTAGIWFVGEDMPKERNCVTPHPSEKDQFDVPIPNVHQKVPRSPFAVRRYAGSY